MVETIENCYRLRFICPGSNDHLNGIEDVDFLKVSDIVLQVLQKKLVEATMVVRLEAANDPSIAWLDLKVAFRGR